MKKNKKNLLIFGSGRLGYEIAIQLSDSYKIFLVDNNKQILRKIKNINKNIEIIFKNIKSENDIKKILEHLNKKNNIIDCSIYCLYPKSKDFGKSLFNLNNNSLKNDLFLQLGLPILFSKQIIKFFLSKKIRGNLILVSSIQGVSAPKFNHYKNTKITSPIEYSAIKSGIIMITRYLAKLLKGRYIRVNCISPGGIISKEQPRLFQKRYKSDCLSKGLLDPQDIVGTVRFLLSDKSKYINGQNIMIDDGWSL